MKDLTNKKFNKLTALKYVGKNKYSQNMWLCKCDCGNEKVLYEGNIISGNTKSCGCLFKSFQINPKSYSKEYGVWGNMKNRCLNKSCKFYKNYGGRGIKVCDRWLKFDNFFDDMGRQPKGMSLDRIDNNKGYYKDNCRWITQKKQMRNTRINRFIRYKRKTMCLTEWAEKLKIHRSTITSRLNNGWSVERAFNQKVR